MLVASHLQMSNFLGLLRNNLMITDKATLLKMKEMALNSLQSSISPVFVLCTCWNASGATSVHKKPPSTAVQSGETIKPKILHDYQPGELQFLSEMSLTYYWWINVSKPCWCDRVYRDWAGGYGLFQTWIFFLDKILGYLLWPAQKLRFCVGSSTRKW